MLPLERPAFSSFERGTKDTWPAVMGWPPSVTLPATGTNLADGLPQPGAKARQAMTLRRTNHGESKRFIRILDWGNRFHRQRASPRCQRGQFALRWHREPASTVTNPIRAVGHHWEYKRASRCQLTDQERRCVHCRHTGRLACCPYDRIA